MAIHGSKTYDVWFLSSKRHTRYVVYYHGKNLSRVSALAVARMLRKKREHKAIVLPHGEAPPQHAATPDYKFRVGQHVRTRSHGVGVVESRQRNFDWSGADDLYRVRVGSTLHLLGESQIVGIPSRRKVTARLKRDVSRHHPPPLPSHEVQTMARMLAKAGVHHPTTAARKLASEGIGAHELAFRLKVDTRPPARSRTRGTRKAARKRTRR